jgi:excisionase family DNA binding protein
MQTVPQSPDEWRESPPRLLVTADHVAGILGVKVSWVREKTREGKFPHVPLGRYVRYDVAAVREWIEAQAKGGR